MPMERWILAAPIMGLVLGAATVPANPPRYRVQMQVAHQKTVLAAPSLIVAANELMTAEMARPDQGWSVEVTVAPGADHRTVSLDIAAEVRPNANDLCRTAVTMKLQLGKPAAIPLPARCRSYATDVEFAVTRYS